MREFVGTIVDHVRGVFTAPARAAKAEAALTEATAAEMATRRLLLDMQRAAKHAAYVAQIELKVEKAARIAAETKTEKALAALGQLQEAFELLSTQIATQAVETTWTSQARIERLILQRQASNTAELSTQPPVVIATDTVAAAPVVILWTVRVFIGGVSASVAVPVSVISTPAGFVIEAGLAPPYLKEPYEHSLPKEADARITWAFKKFADQQEGCLFQSSGLPVAVLKPKQS